MSIVDKIMARDGYKCAECGITNEDHKKRYKRSLAIHRRLPSGIYSLENCISLCCVCHGKKPKERNPPWVSTSGPIPFCLSAEDIMHIDIVRIHLQGELEQTLSRETAIMRVVHAFIQQKGLLK